ncbi:hypothetical protein AKJ63_00305 [candidate division MSBL1 archaeon SCGC-AAA259D18]|uniref:Restriction endonuclease type II NotI domain-containing protein n=1 Tax=candidate division MSBL1 archaeon SCGC-AAA259D18 TaxID=1698262 RepID=A0A133UCM8_9EURY|nr:hypothetical protein AKJ63_00305 [candidate division MSBL1 archaeon SCGC-AAA259D18]
MREIKDNEHLPVEIFGFIPEDKSDKAEKHRESRICPFTEEKCVKEEYRKDNPPVGSCTTSHKGKPHIICPNRFLQDENKLLKKAAKLSFDLDSRIFFVPEITLKNMGRIDWTAIKLDSSGNLIDYVPIEIVANQTTSTGKLTDAVREYEENGKFSKDYYGYGMNTYMQIKTGFTQCLQKGRVFSKWGKKYVWILQDVLFKNWTNRFKLGLEKGSENEIVFMDYKLKFDENKNRYCLTHLKTVSAEHKTLVQAYSEPPEKAPAKNEFASHVEKKGKEKFDAQRQKDISNWSSE